jgi:hypothetical protein
LIRGGIVATIILATTACGGTISATQEPPSDVQPSVSADVRDSAPPPALPTAPPIPAARPGGPATAQPPVAAKALDLLGTLAIKGRAPKTGYDRAEFGQAWADTDHNGCDTRNDILFRDLTAKSLKPGTQGCVVLSGTLADPYTATSIAFKRGASTSSAVQIDHVVALSDAWQKGAQQLTEAQRAAFANDPLNLLAVSGPANQQKSDGDAATWLPGNKAYRCAYVARQISVKAKYKLWVTRAEHDAMATVLGTCVGTPAPTRQSAPATAAAAAAPAMAPYANCTEVRAAGAAPIFAGQPGYSGKLDRDGDGVGCE